MTREGWLELAVENARLAREGRQAGNTHLATLHEQQALFCLEKADTTNAQRNDNYDE